MMGIGTDIVQISRITLTGPFLRGVLSQNELALLEHETDKASFVAGRFAAKEAFLKALGTGLSGAKMNEIDIVYEENGRPVLLYKEKRYAVSIAHDGGYATAVALVES